MMFTIEDARRVQRDLGLDGVHVAFVDDSEDGYFVLAHTGAERASGMNLRDCAIHRWLARQFGEWCRDEAFPEPGWYEITGVHKARGLAL